jgi:fused signal recognition particle receptor
MFNLKLKLKRTRDGFTAPLRKLFGRGSALTADDEESIEELLLGADVGVEASERIIATLKDIKDPGDFRDRLKAEFLSLMTPPRTDRAPDIRPRALIMIGVNGVGKTTTVAKLARYFQKQNKSVLLAACDTFRAAAVDQLSLWAERVNVQCIAHQSGGDPAAVAFDACTAAKARGVDYLILDTAGRLHTKVNLMEELKKIRRVCEKILGPSAVETLLVIDATLGQNSLVQAQEFTKSLEASGIVLTKLDSTAKGGIVIAIKQTLGVPVTFIGVGEGLDDFAAFSPEEFVEALLS